MAAENGNGYLEVRRRGLMLVLSSPSGAGKTTLSRMLLERDGGLEMSVSVTTRPKRPGEVSGVDYHFIEPTEFNLKVNRRELLEWAKVFGHYYGTPRAPVEAALAAGRDVLFDIDWQGGEQLRSRFPDDAVMIWVLPPSLRVLEQRLRGRATDAPAVIDRRLETAKQELQHYGSYDYIVVNDDLESAYQSVRSIYIAAHHTMRRQEAMAQQLLLELGRVP